MVVTGLPPVSFVFVAIPVMPDCHGIEYSRFGSKLGSRSASWRLSKFGIALLSSFSAQPLSISRLGKRELSVRTMMSRSIDCPCESGRWIFPKYVALSLTSSKYATFVPVFCSNSSRVGCFFVFSSMSM
jgi:hypothetical protein